MTCWAFCLLFRVFVLRRRSSPTFTSASFQVTCLLYCSIIFSQLPEQHCIIVSYVRLFATIDSPNIPTAALSSLFQQTFLTAHIDDALFLVPSSHRRHHRNKYDQVIQISSLETKIWIITGVGNLGATLSQLLKLQC